MEIREIENKKIWESFLDQCQERTFLQSWNWGEFSKLMDEKIWRFGIFENQELLAVALVEKKTAKRGTFLLIPHGPVLKNSINTSDIFNILTQKSKELALQEKAAFVRINPISERNEANIKIFKELGFRNAPLQMHPEASWKLNLEPTEAELWSKMRKTTKYLIRQGEKNQDIIISKSTSLEDVKLFSEFHDLVSERQNFIPFSLEYLEKEFKAFNRENEVCLFFARHGNEVAAGAFVIFWSGMGFYHHAISEPKFAKLSIPYRLLWEIVKEAKKRNCYLYDFWGFVDPKKQPRHPWAGPTLFKMGFGGQADEYIKTQDLIVSNKYWLTYAFEKVRKLKRRL
ncbi:peptidoglycan bridge formation glycyltransferase FemA/FemB family protein [Candidatus Parcubacteria bacterium]|nr:peptidoglycan bridge formation glycyltransferase FemA/FemB family protein [Patescibacteria group bacterium]MBU4466511.1 peptidoglycan bridge formation glycyltransferase FemA/FemB family protein [Patescibacteria group bacterium]MCG2688793.1 peptidoglycan bridge formation glycyltransferase FemA/FemB family protein [Candidatus Parcubacteria bacterium]